MASQKKFEFPIIKFTVKIKINFTILPNMTDNYIKNNYKVLTYIEKCDSYFIVNTRLVTVSQ